MAKLKTYTEFVNEALIDAVKNPIKWKKIKNNAKKYQKAKVAQALNDVDHAKRKEKGKANDLPKEKLEILNQANKAKNAALKDAASNVAQRMSDLATTTGLKRVAQLAKTKAALAANQIALKAADGEEARQLKIKQKELATDAAGQQKALADYESTAKKKETDDGPAFGKGGTEEKKETPEQKEKRLAKEKADAEAAAAPAEETPVNDKGKDSTTRPEDGKNSKADIIKRFQDLLDKEEDPASPKAVKLKDKIASLQKESEERFMNPKFVSLLEAELLELGNNYNYVNESIAQKFSRLRETI
jgi:hypothetical protein